MATGHFALVDRKYVRGYGSAAPSTGLWNINDVIVNESPAVNGSPLYWICTASGAPGTWVPVLPLKNLSSVTTISAAGTAALTDNIILIATGGFNVTLTAPTTLS